jgi:hypothetical protein
MHDAVFLAAAAVVADAKRGVDARPAIENPQIIQIRACP